MSKDADISKKKSVFIQQIQQSFVHSPYPPAELLSKYEQVVHGSARRILEMTERQLIHRQEQEKKRLSSIIRLELLGLIAGFSLAIIVLGCACFVALRGFDKLAIVMVSTTVLFVIVVFVLRKTPSSNK